MTKDCSGRVAGKSVIVTGGSRGLGESFVRMLYREGANVLIADVLDAPGEALAAELGERTAFVHLDVTSELDWAKAVEIASTRFGDVDVLVNNAGIGNMGPIGRYPLEDWNRIMAVNATGTFLGISAVAPGMAERGAGSIVNISSLEGIRGTAGVHGYVASKFAVTGLTKSVALELAPKGVRVNSVHPGWIETPLLADMDAIPFAIPAGRGGRVGEVASIVTFLASDESSYCIGSEFVVDGGLSAGVPGA